MKYIKILMLFVAASFFVACSDDDDFNTTEATIGFESENVVVKESSGLINVPIKVEGARNGNIQLAVTAEPVGADGAVEDVHYMITSKNLNVLADTLKSTTVNVEIKVIDNPDINDPRAFVLTIASANGAKVTTQKTTITIRDNDAAFYEKFFGKWKLTAIDSDGNNVSKDVTIGGAVDEEAPDYDHILTANAPGLFNFGVSIDCAWRFRYSFDKATKKGTLAFICGDLVASYGSAYQWTWATDDGVKYTFDDVEAEWALGAGDSFPTEIAFDPDATLYLYQPGAGWWELIYNIKLTKK